MNDRKNSVLLYTDDIDILEELSLEQRGLLFTAILSYQAGAELPEMDCTTKIAFKFMKKQIDNNNKAYESTCEQRKKAAETRWSKKNNADALNDNAKNANACSRISSHSTASIRNAKNADNDNDIDIDNTAEAVLNARETREEPSATKKSQERTLEELSQEQLKEIINKWNANKCTQSIDKIVLMSTRYDNTRRCVGLYGYDDFLSTLSKVDNNKWFSSRDNPVTFDWYVKPDNYQKVHDGNYKQVFRKKNNFLNFEQRDNENLYADLEKVIFD